MALGNKGEVPMPPLAVPYFLSLKLSRMGRQDIKKYKNLQDSTRTHAIMQIEQIALQSQGLVNQWLISAMVPLVSGNGQIRTQVEAIREIIRKNQPSGHESMRVTKRMLEANVVSESKITSLLQQCKANVALAESKVLAAEDAMRAWVDYYQALAGIYMRARTRRSKSQEAVAMASIPIFSSRPLSDVPEFDKNACSDVVKVRK